MCLRNHRALLQKLVRPTPLFLLTEKRNPNPNRSKTQNPNPNPNRSKTQNPNPITEKKVLSTLRNQPNVSLSLAQFKSLSTSFSHTSLTYQLMIRKLCQSNQIDTAQYLLQQMKLENVKCTEETLISLIKSYSQNNFADRAVNLFHRADEFGLVPTVRIYNHLLDALLIENKFGLISPLYETMKKDGIKPNVYTYNILIKALCRNNRVDKAKKLLEEMCKKGVFPDEVSFCTVISSLCGLGLINEAKGILVNLPSNFPHVSCYNALIHGLCDEFSYKEAIKLFDEMSIKGVKPNVITCTILIDAFCKIGDLDLACGILGKMEIWGLNPNILTYTSLIKGFFKIGRVNDALYLWDYMIKENCVPNLIAYNVLIHGLCINGILQKALSVFNNMEKMGIYPNVTTYSTLIDGFSKIGDINFANNIWEKMIQNGCKPNVITYTSMIEALCKSLRFDDAYDLLRKMKTEKNCAPNIITFNVLIKGLCENGSYRTALSLLSEMKQMNLVPNIRTNNELLQGLFKEGEFTKAIELFKDMLINSKNDMNLVTYNIMIHGFCKNGMENEALVLTGLMICNGFKPDSRTLHPIINLYCKKGEIRKASNILNGLGLRDKFLCTTFINGLCGLIKLDFAIVYMIKMIYFGFVPNYAIWSVLVRGVFENLGQVGSVPIFDEITGDFY